MIMRNISKALLRYERIMKSSAVCQFVIVFNDGTISKNYVKELSDIFRKLLRYKTEDQFRDLYYISAEMRDKYFYNEDLKNYNNIFIECLHNEILRSLANKGVQVEIACLDDIYNRCCFNNLLINHRLLLKKFDELNRINKSKDMTSSQKAFYLQRRNKCMAKQQYAEKINN